MSSIFSAISGHLTRSLVLGTFLPVVVFSVMAVTFLTPLLPKELTLVAPLRALDKEWVPWLLVLTTLAITGLLYNLNTPLIRLYEGYPWKGSRLGKWRIRRYEARVKRASLAKTRFILLRKALSDPTVHSVRASVQDELNAVARELNTLFPGAGLVLPTRFGNVVRSFEEYSRHQYGMSAIPLWPRMTAHINKDYAALIDDTKSSVDFALNSSFLLSVLAAGLFAAGILRRAELFQTSLQMLSWLLAIAAFVFVAYLMYLVAVNRAAEWGVYVKGAFDLYRRDLLKQLGYKHQPVAITEERELWKQISRQIVFGDPLEGAPTPFDPATATVSRAGFWKRLVRWMR